MEEVEPVEEKEELPSELPEAETAPPPEEPLETETPAVDTESEILEKEMHDEAPVEEVEPVEEKEELPSELPEAEAAPVEEVPKKTTFHSRN